MRLLTGFMLVLFLQPATAGLFSDCDGSKEPQPEWVGKPDYSLAGYHVGVGVAEKEGRNNDEVLKASEANAKNNLVQRIEVTIRAENEQLTRVNGDKVEKNAQSKIVASAEEVLRDLQIKARWMDGDTCQLHTLMVVSQQSVAQSRREKIMKNRLEKFKQLLAEGSDRQKNRDVKQRGKYLDEARALIMETDFSVLPDELGKDHYITQLNKVVAAFNKEAANSVGRMALFALNPDGSLTSGVAGKIIDQLRQKQPNADRLMSDCAATAEACINQARERGFAQLSLVHASTQTSTSQMGALKGVMTLTRTLYDIESHKVIKNDSSKGEVIGWSDAELDWETAAIKAVENLR